MIHSLHFGRAFWLDEENELCSAPLFNDGTVDTAQMDYVGEWTDLEGVSMDHLTNIIKRLIDEKTDRYYNNLNKLNQEA